MNLVQLKDDARKRISDISAPYLYPDDQIVRWLNEAVSEACVRARLKYDEDSNLCKIPIVDSVAVYQLDPSIYEIVDAWLVPVNGTTAGRLLVGTSQSALDEQSSQPDTRTHFTNYRGYYQSSYPYWLGGNWRTWKGTPIYFIRDLPRLQLVPIPSTGSLQFPMTLNLACFRVPTCSEEMAADKDVPIIPSLWHHHLPIWVEYRAYNQLEADEREPGKRAQALADFEAIFGKRPDANTTRKQNQLTRKTTRVNW